MLLSFKYYTNALERMKAIALTLTNSIYSKL